MNTLHPKSRPRTSAAFALGPPHPQNQADTRADAPAELHGELNADFEWPSDAYAYADAPAQPSLCPRAEAFKRGAYLVGMLALFLGFLVLLSGCGPGTGGTGVGPTPIAAGSSSPSSSSSALPPPASAPSTLAFSGSFTSAVGAPATPPSLPAPTTGAAPAPSTPTATITSVLTLLLEPERVLLSSACLSFVSFAPLPAAAPDATSPERVLPGVFEQTRKVQGQTSRTSVPASLLLRFAETPSLPSLPSLPSMPSLPSSSPSVRLSIQDSAGKLLLGPVDLQRLGSVPVQGEAPASVEGCL